MTLSLDDGQLSALDSLRSGSILCGGVGSGKSRVALAYYYLKEGKGSLSINGCGRVRKMKNDVLLVIITTAHKRDLCEWELEARYFPGVMPVVDSWNNIQKYTDIHNAFFIFDEQRVVGYGAWSKAFIKISRTNRWILLSATPGDTWMDYVPVFIANGFYPNKTAFERRHVVYSRFAKYPKVEKYVGIDILEKFRKQILVQIPFQRPTFSHHEYVNVPYDKLLTDKVIKERWDVFEKKPLRDAGAMCLILRRIANAEPERLNVVFDILKRHKKVIVFYNFNYELDMLKEAFDACGAGSVERPWSREFTNSFMYSEWNGHTHEAIPTSDCWVYLVQYTAGAEGWNCITTDTVLFYSQNYSYKIMQQAAGRIDRRNTPFTDLYYYHLMSNSPIDISIKRALDNKKTFNERAFYDSVV